MRYALVLRINDRMYPFTYEKAEELNLAIAEVVPNGITLRLGRAPGNSMVLGIKEWDPAIIKNFGLVNYVSNVYTASTIPRWIPSKLVSAQKIVDGVLQEGTFDLDPAIPTVKPLTAESEVTEWKPKPNGQRLKPDVEKDAFYLSTEPERRVFVFSFKTPDPVMTDSSTTPPNQRVVDWLFGMNWAIPTWCDILDEEFKVVTPTASNRTTYRLKFNAKYHIAVRAYSPDTNSTTIPAVDFWPYLGALSSTHSCHWVISDWDAIKGNQVDGARIDMNSCMLQRASGMSGSSTNRAFRFTTTKNELVRFGTGGGWFYTFSSIRDVTTGTTVYQRYLGGNQYYQLLANRTYEVVYSIYSSWYETTYVQFDNYVPKFSFTQVEMITDQPLETRKAATWYDWSAAQGHAQLFPSLSASLRTAGYYGVSFGMTIASWNYEIYVGYDYYPWMLSVFELEDVINYRNGGPMPVPIVSNQEANSYNRWQPIASWKDNANLVVGKVYVIEIATRNLSWGRVTTQIRPISTVTTPTVSKPTDRVNATIAELEKQIRIPIRFDHISTK